MSSLWGPEWYHLLLPPVLIVRLWLADAVKLLVLWSPSYLRWAFVEAPVIWWSSDCCLQTWRCSCLGEQAVTKCTSLELRKASPTLHAINIFTLRVNLFILQRFITGCFYLVSLRHGMSVEYLALRGIMVHLNILLQRYWRKSQHGRYLEGVWKGYMCRVTVVWLASKQRNIKYISELMGLQTTLATFGSYWRQKVSLLSKISRQDHALTQPDTRSVLGFCLRGKAVKERS